MVSLAVLPTPNPSPLPIDALLPEIVERLRAEPILILEAAPGAGKTTRVPPALLTFGEVITLEPRRMAARMAARRVAEEMGERLGETVGYQVRFEESASGRTRLRFVTEGVLTRRLLRDPTLKGVAVVVLDEFHERHLDGDAAFALLRHLQATARPDLRLVVMSATLDSAALGALPAIKSAGRMFDTKIEYTPHSSAPLEEQVASAIERAAPLDGDVLIFLPGAREIRAAMRAAEGATARLNAVALPLHGDLSPEEQDRAVLPALQRKIIFSTNVAESSLTIDGVTLVIDSGLARIARDSPHTGLPELTVGRISQASATQRAGRAGRTRPGRVIRLYPQEDLLRRPTHDTPEILRRELSALCLELDAMGVADIAALPWLDPPPQPSLDAARALLERLGATGPDEREMSRLPVHPRLAAMLVEARRREAGEIACTAAAWLSSGDRSPTPRNLLDGIEDDPSYTVRRTRDQLLRLIRPERHSKSEEGLALAILRGFPERVRKTRDGRLVVALDVEERKDRPEPLMRLFLPVQPEMLIEMFPSRVEERKGVEWHRTGDRVESVDALLYEGIAIQETRGGAIDPVEAARLLAEKALEAGIARFTNAEELDSYRKRRNFAELPLDEDAIHAALEDICSGLRSFNELSAACRDGAFLATLDARLTPAQRKRLEEYAPPRLKLPSGRTVPIRYDPDKPPVAAARLQEFFGMRETPRIAGGKVSLLIELLAPNMRPVQTTTDLAGFWQRLYPQLRKELGRRYPKHSWPEDPLTAVPRHR